MGKATRKIPGIRQRATKDGRIVYYLDTTVYGVVLNERAGFSEKQAVALLAKRRAEIYDRKHFPNREKAGLTIDSLLHEYWERHLKYRKSGRDDRFRTLSRLGRELGHFVVESLRPSDVEAYQRKRLGDAKAVTYMKDGKKERKEYGKISPRTVDIEVDELKMAINWGVKERIISYNPIETVKKLDYKEPEKVMLDDGTENGPEWQKLYNAASDDLKPRIYLQYMTGMRMSEVCGLKWAYIDMMRKVIDLPPEAVKNVRPEAPKGRSIPLYTEVIQFLSALPHNSEYVFTDRKTGKPIKSYICQFRRAVVKAGLPRSVTSHALRRTRAQIWDRVDVRMSMAAIGHAEERVHTRHYTKIKPDMMRVLTDKPTQQEQQQQQAAQ